MPAAGGARGGSSRDEYCRGRLLFPLTNHPPMSRGGRAAMFYSPPVDRVDTGRSSRVVCAQELPYPSRKAGRCSGPRESRTKRKREEDREREGCCLNVPKISFRRADQPVGRRELFLKIIAICYRNMAVVEVNH